ncbi:SIR2 family protein [Paraburkholderia dipogonis]|uniref:SIR2 family protein n=1 Tax=Paraburkholderia dipogonis TaxID=1211383 RepID=UPI0038BAD8CE
MSIEDKLTEILKSRGAGPFLFVGSGFSRRYLGLEDWKGLLSRFCVTGNPFEYYLASADGDYPKAAKLLSQDFNQYWWKAVEYSANVERYKSRVIDSTSALRIEISNYLSSLSEAEVKKSAYVEEIELLSSLNVDGIITTNWDIFLEQLFPDYKTYIGQDELLFSNPQEIGEIYKVHGCATKPESLVLTSDDYAKFHDKNPYLAAKLITVFVEHPVLFIGYSISDANISDLLRSISLCVGKENIEKLRKNLIFVQRVKDGEEGGISDTYLTIDGVQIPLILVQTNDYAEVYKALGATKRKIPARVLRYCKEQLYELVKSLEPEKKLAVVDIDSIEQKEDVEFLVGVGVTSHASSIIGEIGYEAIEAQDLISDLIHENKKYDANRIVTSVIKKAGRNTQNVPVFKYLHEIGINSEKSYSEKKLDLDKWVNRDLKDFRVKMYSGPFYKRRHQNISEIISTCTAEQASTLIPFLARDKIDLDVLRTFLIENEAKFEYAVSNYASYFRKLASIYDRLKWGW